METEVPIDLTECLMSFVRRHNYPLVSSMSPDDILNIFQPTNRCFLIFWALNRMENVEFLNDFEGDIKGLAHFLCCTGLCPTDALGLHFLEGKLVNQEDNIRILCDIFKYVDWQLMITRQPLNEMFVPNMFVDLEHLEQQDMNLFPQFGRIKAEINKEHKELFKEFQSSILEVPPNHQVINNISKGVLGDIKTMSDKALDNIEKFQFTIEKVKKLPPPQGIVDINEEEMINDAKNNLEITLQYSKDVQTIMELPSLIPSISAQNYMIDLLESLSNELIELN